MCKDIDIWLEYTKEITPIADCDRLHLLCPEPSLTLSHIGHHSYLDLHGLSVQAAYKKTLEFIDRANQNGLKKVTIITGKSGAIRKEFPEWLSRYHVTDINGGSFSVKIR